MTGYSHLTNEELSRIAAIEFDALTATSLQTELMKRFDALIDAEAARQELDAAIDKSDFDLSEIPEILRLLEIFNVDSTRVLTEKLKRADDWYGLADEAGDLFSRLEALRASTV